MILNRKTKIIISIVIFVVCTFSIYLAYCVTLGRNQVISVPSSTIAQKTTLPSNEENIIKFLSMCISILAFGLSWFSLFLNQPEPSNIKIASKKIYYTKDDNTLNIFAFNSGKLSGRIKIINMALCKKIKKYIIFGKNRKREKYENIPDTEVGYNNPWVIEPMKDTQIKFPINNGILSNQNNLFILILYQTIDQGRESRVFKHTISLVRGDIP